MPFLSHIRSSLVPALLAASLLGGVGCSTPSAKVTPPVSDDNYWELPDEPLTYDKQASNKKKRPERPKETPPATVKPTPPAPVEVNEPPVVIPPADSAESADASAKSGWWPFRGSQERTPDPVPEKDPVSPPPPTEVVAPPQATEPPDSDTAMSTVLAYRLRVGDGLIVRITGPEQHLVEDQIDERGNISLPLISEPVRVEGMTGSELEARIRALYVQEKKIYRRCSVTVIVPGRTYTMDGEFLKKGTYPISPGVTLVRAVASAGGFGPWANPKKLILIRQGVRQTINYYDLRDDPNKDIIIEPGDILIAPRSRI